MYPRNTLELEIPYVAMEEKKEEYIVNLFSDITVQNEETSTHNAVDDATNAATLKILSKQTKQLQALLADVIKVRRCSSSPFVICFTSIGIVLTVIGSLGIEKEPDDQDANFIVLALGLFFSCMSMLLECRRRAMVLQGLNHSDAVMNDLQLAQAQPSLTAFLGHPVDTLKEVQCAKRNLNVYQKYSNNKLTLFHAMNELKIPNDLSHLIAEYNLGVDPRRRNLTTHILKDSNIFGTKNSNIIATINHYTYGKNIDQANDGLKKYFKR